MNTEPWVERVRLDMEAPDYFLVHHDMFHLMRVAETAQELLKIGVTNPEAIEKLRMVLQEDG